MGSSRRARARRWLLLDGDRDLLASAVVVGVFLVIFGLHRVGLLDVTDQAAVRTAAGGMVPGLFAFLSIVLGINQLVLSRQFGAADDVADRLEDVEEFRHAVEAKAGVAPSPVVPTDFLSLVVRAVGTRAAALRESVPDDPPTATVTAVTDLVRNLEGDVDAARARLDATDAGRINALLTVLEFPDAEYRYRARRVDDDHGEALSPESREALDDLVETLGLFEVARTHFRTTYTERTLARLSRQLLYVGIPALLAAFALVLLSGSAATPFDPVRAPLVSALLAGATSPVAVLSSYVLRIATVSERTIAVGAFVSRPGTADGTDRRGTDEAIDHREGTDRDGDATERGRSGDGDAPPR